MTPAHAPRTRRKRLAVTALVASSLLMGGAGAAGGQEADPTPPTTDAPRAVTHRLRARVKPGPNAGFGSAKSLPAAMGSTRSGACNQVHNVVWDGTPKSSSVRLRLIRQEGNPDSAKATSPGGACAAKEEKESGYKARVKVTYPLPGGGKKTTGKLRLGKALNVLAGRVNGMRDKVMQNGKAATFTLKVIRVKKHVPGMIRGMARRYSLSVSKSLSVAKCESGYDPKAYNPAGPWAGVYQQDTDYWPGRAKKFGHPGESVFDAYANVDVSLQMARSMGWHHWACA